MTVSILRTADAWWVQTPSGAARIRTNTASTAEATITISAARVPA